MCKLIRISILCLFSSFLQAGFSGYGYIGWLLSYDNITGEPKLQGVPILHSCPEPIMLDYDKLNHSDPNIRKRYADELRSRSKKIKSCVDERNKKSDIEDKRKESLTKIYELKHNMWLQGYKHSTYDWNNDGVIAKD